MGTFLQNCRAILSRSNLNSLFFIKKPDWVKVWSHVTKGFFLLPLKISEKPDICVAALMVIQQLKVIYNN